MRQISDTWLVALAAALRLLGIAWAMAVTPVHTTGDAAETVIDDLGLADHPEAADLLAQITVEEKARTAADRGWVVAFIVTLFAIHIARQEPDGTLFGYAAPGIAVVGDMMLALLFALLFVVPVSMSLLTSTRWLERIGLALVPLGRPRPARAAASPRGRVAALSPSHGDAPARGAVLDSCGALESLGAGLPVAAVVAATVPVWGMSWFFDTENWATGIWNSWAEARTDRWREPWCTP
jgi:hypothetical protein